MGHDFNPANATLEIRNARPSELTEVSFLLRDAYQQYENCLPPDVWKYYLEDIMDVRSRLDASELIVATVGGHLAGTVTLYSDILRLQGDWLNGWASIRLLAVHPANRRLGIGRALMEECVCRCRERSVSVIGLHTTEIMDVARKMYEQMGFVRAPEFDFHPAPGRIVMAYRLDL
jgi:ribosomal protein S18 acetylase RimI-like enzyme